MAKRFSDTDKWKKPFLRSLKAPYKLLWLYILDDCDHAGIWQVDLQIAEIKIGEKLDYEEALKQFGERILVFNDGDKWLIKDFIEFQYGELNPKNRVHLSVLNILDKYKIKPLISPLQGAKDKDKDKYKDKDKEKDTKITTYDEFYLSRKEAYKNYPIEFTTRLENDFGVVSCLCYSTDKLNDQYKDFVDIIYQATTDNDWIMQISRDTDKSKIRHKLTEFINYCLTSQCFRTEKYLNHYEFQKHFVNKYLRK
jgi:hypothetical protein